MPRCESDLAIAVKPLYDRDFFGHQTGGSLRAARRVLPIILEMIRPTTVVDIGCGIGAWASVAKELGCVVTAVDGDWVPREQLLVATDEFRTLDLAAPFVFERQFDLAMSLEVAEHLPASAARTFVNLLTSASSVVLFSGAIPFQKGTAHVNEQYPSYWAALFAEAGFQPLDLIRPRCWDDREIEFYYRQNVLVFAREPQAADLRARYATTVPHPLDLVHPDAVPILAQGWVESLGVARSFTMLRRTFEASVIKRFRGRG